MEDTKARLLHMATRLFAEQGFDSVSIRQISDAAGVNSAMISYYFGSKQGLYNAVLAQQTGMICGFLKDAEAEGDPREVIRKYGETMLLLHEKNPYLLYYLHREIVDSAEGCSVFQDLAPLLFRLLASAIRNGIDNGLFRKDLDVFSAVFHLAGIVNAYFMSHRMHTCVSSMMSIPTEAVYIRQAVDVFLRGIERRDSQ